MTAGETEAVRHGGRSNTPVHLWIVGGLALLWNAMGAFDYLATMIEFEPYMSSFSEEQLEYFYGFPAWVVSTWAVAVWGAFFGAIALLLRSRWAVWLFGASLVGFVLTSLYNFVLSNGAEIMGGVGVAFSAAIGIIAILLVIYARRMSARGVLG